MKRISLCMIVRDEETRLSRCLAAAQSVADEICIVDTGSTDRTVDIAREFGAQVLEIPWTGDFAAARNASLAMASGEWILVLDADEVLVDPALARDELHAFMANEPRRVGRLLQENVDQEGERSCVAISRFFHAGDYAFEGRIHEQLVPGREGAEDLRRNTRVRLEHGGYALSASDHQAKLERNTHLLLEAVEANPDDGYLWFQLGRTRAQAGDHATALEALEQAMARCPDEAPWAPSLFETGCYSLRALGRSEQALALISEVEETWIDRADTCFLIALLAMDCGDLARAERGFLRCFELDGEERAELDCTVASHTHAPAFNLGVMKEVLGEREEAESWFRKALEFEPEHAPSLQALTRLGVAV